MRLLQSCMGMCMRLCGMFVHVRPLPDLKTEVITIEMSTIEMSPV